MNFKKLFTSALFLLFVTSIVGQKIVRYIPYYRGYNSNYDYTKYTHLHYFAIWPAADGTFIYPGSEDSLSMATEFAQLKAAVAGSDTKMIMSFGGTSENGSKFFADMAKNTQYRANFITNVIKYAYPQLYPKQFMID
jgi:GH18 family chitinase